MGTDIVDVSWRTHIILVMGCGLYGSLRRIVSWDLILTTITTTTSNYNAADASCSKTLLINNS